MRTDAPRPGCTASSFNPGTWTPPRRSEGARIASYRVLSISLNVPSGFQTIAGNTDTESFLTIPCQYAKGAATGLTRGAVEE